ncbi:MAG: hypothetical protein ACI9MR_001880 [Myxococcota bacterium]|jgi:hypothetical protein
MKKVLASLLSVALLALPATALASTPDGETPAEETVCDGLTLQGGLFGLCNAYCKAMDCDSDFTHASDRACDRVLANFHKKSGDVDPPCLDGNCGDEYYARAEATYNACLAGGSGETERRVSSDQCAKIASSEQEHCMAYCTKECKASCTATDCEAEEKKLAFEKSVTFEAMIQELVVTQDIVSRCGADKLCISECVGDVGQWKPPGGESK